MLSYATTPSAASTHALHSLWHALPRGFAENSPAPAGAARSHAQAVGQLLALMKPQGLSKACDESADVCLSAFVNSRLQVADDLADQSSTDESAICLAETYQTLLSIVHQTPSLGAWHQSALWHSRRLHCALLNHLEEYGGHPAIDDAFRAGCLTLHVPAGQLH